MRNLLLPLKFRLIFNCSPMDLPIKIWGGGSNETPENTARKAEL